MPEIVAMSAPQTIAHYKITAKLGEGGMGEVWRATDTKLGRDVAIKILPEAFAQDADRMARFAREAQVLVSLNHPNIAAIYGLEDRALVMELVEGPTLACRITQGPLPLEEALPIARQIAEALEYAHEKGIIHRDLKPANIKLTPEGHVKVLDFGLAKALAKEPYAADSVSSPTLTMGATLAGAILGTAAYMSPEQAKGKTVDRRADIWAFGVILMEMLTGQPMYSGETLSEILAAVIMKEPDLGSLPAATPASIHKLIVRCLDRDPLLRLRDIGEARVTLQKYLANPAAEERVKGAGLRPSIGRAVSPWGAVVLAIAVVVLAGLLWRGTPAATRPWMRFSAELGPDAVVGSYFTVAVSPDSTRIAFPVRAGTGSQLATRLMDQSKANVLTGTEGPAALLLSRWRMDRLFRRGQNEEGLGARRLATHHLRRHHRTRCLLGGG
jgi:serine/threonine-protein kinase